MADNIVTIPYSYFPDFSVGRPLFNADIYVGEPDLDPEDIPDNQKEIKLRTGDGTEVVVSQPVNTGSGGVVSYNGSAATIIVDGEYSILVNNSSGSLVYYSANVTKGEPLTPETLVGLTNLKANTVADMIAGTTSGGTVVAHSVGDVWTTSGYYSIGDGGQGTYLVTAASVTDGYVNHTSSNGNTLTLQPVNGAINALQCGMIENGESTVAYNAAASYVVENGLTLDLLGKVYNYNIAVSAIGVTIDGHDNWRIINGTLNRTSTFAVTETATIHKLLNVNDWEIELNVTGPETVFSSSIGTDTNKGYQLAWVELNAERFKVAGKVSDNYGALLTGGGPATTSDGSVKNFTADIEIANNQYGVNCANRGDVGRIKVVADKSHRPYFPYGVDDHEIDIEVTTPGTVSSLIATYDADTTNIRGNISIQYSDDEDSRGSLNGGVDIETIGTINATGKIDGLDLRVVARSEAFGPNNYRPVVGFQSNTVSQRIQNVNIDVDIEGWEGNGSVRPPIGYVEQTGYDSNNNPVFTGVSVEPIFDNITIKGRVNCSASTNANVELTSSLLEGKMTFQIDGSGFFRARNHSTNASARIDVLRCSLKNATGGNGASIDYAYMSTSANTWIGKSYNENLSVITLPGQAEYQREDETFFGAGSSPGSPANVQIAEVQPIDFQKYTIDGFTADHVFSGILQIRTTGGVIDSNSDMLQFVSTANGGVFGMGNIAVSGVNVVGGYLQITFSSSVPSNLNFMQFSLKPYGSIGNF